MKRKMSIILTILLFATSIMRVDAFEQTKTDKLETNITALASSGSSILTVKVNKASPDVVKVLSDNGAEVNGKSVIEVLKINDSNDTAICVMNVDDDEVKKDVFIAFEEDENNNMVVNNTMAEVLSQGYDSSDYMSKPDMQLDGSYVVHVTTTSKIFSDFPMVYYQPYYVEFVYENFDNVNVGYIGVDYVCSGFLRSIPEFEQVGTEPIEHIVSVFASNPTPYITYSNTNSMDPNYALNTGEGAPGIGRGLDFSCYINGQWQYFSFPL